MANHRLWLAFILHGHSRPQYFWNVQPLDHSIQTIHETYKFNVSCQGSVPQSIVAFLEATDFEEAIRNAISLGGDADTMACIADGIAEAFGGVPSEIEKQTMELLNADLRAVVVEFNKRFRTPKPETAT